MQNTIDLALAADRLGYERYGIAEHHAMETLARPAPEILTDTRRCQGDYCVLAFSAAGRAVVKPKNTSNPSIECPYVDTGRRVCMSQITRRAIFVGFTTARKNYLIVIAAVEKSCIMEYELLVEQHDTQDMRRTRCSS